MGIAFELILLILFVFGFLMADGRIPVPKAQREEFRSWQYRNGNLIKMLCAMTVILLIGAIIIKYIHYRSKTGPGLDGGLMTGLF